MEKLILTTVLITGLGLFATASGSTKTSALPAAGQQIQKSYLPFDQSIELSTQNSMTQAQKGKLQIIYFWATWCPDCKDKFKKDLSAYSKEGVDFFTLSIEDNKKKIEKFVAKEEVKHPVFFDPDRELQKQLKVFSVPTVVVGKVMNGEFKVLAQVSGKDWTVIDQVVEQELNRKN